MKNTTVCNRPQSPILSAIYHSLKTCYHISWFLVYTHFASISAVQESSLLKVIQTNPCTTVDVGYRIVNYCHSGKENRSFSLIKIKLNTWINSGILYYMERHYQLSYWKNNHDSEILDEFSQVCGQLWTTNVAIRERESESI